MNVFSQKLRELMFEKKISQVDLAIMSNVSPSSISMYLSGKVIPRPNVIQDILKVFDLPPDYFEKNSNEQRLTVASTAKRMGKSKEFVALGLQLGVFPFGFAVKTSSRWNYFISEKKLNEYI